MTSIRIVLVDTSHPGNIGAAARALKNMGLAELALVRPQQFPHEQATARASGADDLLARATVSATLAEALAGCGLVLGASARPRSANWVVLDPRAAASRLRERALEAPAAVVFGNERNGLSNEDLSLCHALLNIPANPEYESLNLAQAVQIVTWEIRMAANPSPRTLGPESPLATVEEVLRLREHFERALSTIGFIDARNAPGVLGRIERLLARAEPDQKEVQILRGMLTAMERAAARQGGPAS